MKELPAIELLESTHVFPGPYTFKVIGRSDQGFLARTVAGVREALARDVDPPYRVRGTSSGRHIAITLEPTVQTAREVLAVYRRLGPMAGLVFLW